MRCVVFEESVFSEREILFAFLVVLLYAVPPVSVAFLSPGAVSFPRQIAVVRPFLSLLQKMIVI